MQRGRVQSVVRNGCKAQRKRRASQPKRSPCFYPPSVAPLGVLSRSGKPRVKPYSIGGSMPATPQTPHVYQWSNLVLFWGEHHRYPPNPPCARGAASPPPVSPLHSFICICISVRLAHASCGMLRSFLLTIINTKNLHKSLKISNLQYI